jgi:Uma2 family endonuclease
MDDDVPQEPAMSTAEKPRMTEREYLAFERTSREKHELVNGEVVAMAGASPRHNRIVGNITGALWSRLRGRPCAALPADQRVHVPRTGLYTYPDVTVVCGSPRMHPEDDLTVLNPTVVVEVLSSSTEAYDRGAKASHYRSIPELSEYVLVAQAERRVEHYRRLDGDRWLFVEYRAGDEVELAALGISIPLDEIYEGAESYPGDERA